MSANPLKGRGASGEVSPTDPYECAEWANARMAPEHQAIMRYVVVGGKMQLQRRGPFVQSKLAGVMDRRGQPMSEADTAELNGTLESLNATARYRSDGSHYMIEAAS